jgi:hypothetical protein
MKILIIISIIISIIIIFCSSSCKENYRDLALYPNVKNLDFWYTCTHSCNSDTPENQCSNAFMYSPNKNLLTGFTYYDKVY